MEIRWLETIHNKHEGEPIWIVGSGHEIDEFPDNFLDDKLAISLHTAWLRWEHKFTYAHISEVDRLEWFKEYRPDFFKTIGIYNNPFYLNVPSEWAVPEKELEKHYYLAYQAGIMEEDLMLHFLFSAIEGEHGPYMNAYTCLHTGMLAAIILGSRELHLIGCNHSAPLEPNKFYFSKGQLEGMRLHKPEFNTWAANTAGNYTNMFIEILNRTELVKVFRYVNYEHYKFMRKTI
jgi:hypothetical protein